MIGKTLRKAASRPSPSGSASMNCLKESNWNGQKIRRVQNLIALTEVLTNAFFRYKSKP